MGESDTPDARSVGTTADVGLATTASDLAATPVGPAPASATLGAAAADPAE